MPITKSAFIRSTVLAILVGMVALLVIVGITFWLVEQARIYSDAVTEARIERSVIADLRNMLDDAETGQRGYLLTRDQVYLAPYLDVRNRIPQELERVRKLTADDPAQKENVAKLAPAIDGKLAELQNTIDVFNAGRQDEALALVKTDRGRILMDETRKLFTTMVERADRNIGEAVQADQESIRLLQWVTFGGALVILLVIGGSAWTVLLYTRQLLVAQREVATLNVGLEERVHERTADLGRANEEIQRFAYIVTHDLRAPLVNIMGFTSELESCLGAIGAYFKQSGGEASEDPVVKDAQAAALQELPEAIGFIRSSTRKMDGLINAILKLSREGRRVLKPEPIGLEKLLRTAADNVQHQVSEAGGDVVIDGTFPQVVSDRLALEQIFGNLLDNAVKYRAPGRPLKIQVRGQEERGQRIVIEVADNGRGIAKQDHQRVFDLFRRSGSQDQPGEGIGLAHVRTMIRNLGGEITLQSDLDQGTTMKLNLPRDLRKVMAAQAGAA